MLSYSPPVPLAAIPKNESVFQVPVYNLTLTIFGKHINMRPAERSVKKVKQFMDLDIWELEVGPFIMVCD